MESVIFNTHDVVLLMTAWQCILFALLLLALGRGHMPRNLFLALFLFSHAAIPLDILINFGAVFRDVALNISPNLFYIFGLAYWLEGPLLLWYTRSVIYKDYRPKRYELVYLAPFLLYLIYEIVFYFSLPTDVKIAMQQGYQLEHAPRYMNYVTFFRELMRAAFGFACLIEINRYRASLRDNFSDVQALDFQWLKLLVIGFLGLRVMAVLVLLMILASVHFGFVVDFSTAGLTANYLAFLLVSMLIFFSLKYSWLTGGVREEAAKPDHADKDKDKDKGYDEKQIERLLRCMSEDKPYLQPSLSVDQLAHKVGISQKVLSNIINRHFNCNFFEFVNQYRIDTAKALLAGPESQKKSVLDVLYASGFNSKATFNTLFKKCVGTTPSEYRKKHAVTANKNPLKRSDSAEIGSEQAAPAKPMN